MEEKILLKKSKIHATGAYAKKDLKKGERVIEYMGHKITKEESKIRTNEHMQYAQRDRANRGAVWIFELNKKYDIDGNIPNNPAKFINHSCSPNCEVEITRGRIWIVAKKKIKQGEEITYNYGYDVDEYKDHPCYCGSKRCVGYIVEEIQWPKLKKLLRN